MTREQLRATMIAKFKEPGMTDAEAYEAYRAHMRAIGSRGGKQTTGETGFALMSDEKHQAASLKGAANSAASRRAKK